jgi:6,7-dimethyl-8-ribityllumazine synthase
VSGEAPAFVLEGAEGLRVALLTTHWHWEITNKLLAGARRALSEAGIANWLEVTVPGCFELTVAASRATGAGYEAVVCLGVVIQGDTPHFDYLCQATAIGLNEVAARSGVPVAFGVLTCQTEELADERADDIHMENNKGFQAAQAAVAAALALRKARL